MRFSRGMSGLTTTGATIITELDMPASILLWRALFVVWRHRHYRHGHLCFAMLNVGGMQLFRLESPTHRKDRCAHGTTQARSRGCIFSSPVRVCWPMAGE